jgi:hypothetical protein
MFHDQMIPAKGKPMRRQLIKLLLVIGLLACSGKNPVAANDAAAIADSIDRHIKLRLDSAGLPHAAQSDDAEFLRRTFLDLHGVVPPAERVRRFLDSNDDGKRIELIDELLASPRFGEYFADLWRARLLSPLATEHRQSQRFADWLADRFNSNDGWNHVVYDLLTAAGKIDQNPAVIYLIEGRYPLGVADLTDLSTRYFLGVRLNCAQCHDHPFVEWKRQDYWGMAAFFAQIQTPGRPKKVYLAGVEDDPKITLSSMQNSDAIDGFQSQPPTFLGGQKLQADGNATLRASLARWITSAENPYFARAMVNRMWWHFFGRGIVNPVDDMHTGNRPSHPELLEEVARRFAQSGFDLKLLCRAIIMSRTYQQTSRLGGQVDADAQLFLRIPIKVLTAEQLYDSLVQILGRPGKSRAIDARLNARYEFCQFFASDGDPDPTRYERGIQHMLRLMNSPQFAGRNISAFVARIAGSTSSAGKTVDELFLTILARYPTAAEQKFVQEQVRRKDASPHDAYRELAWALLMSSEFSLNH